MKCFLKNRVLWFGICYLLLFFVLVGQVIVIALHKNTLERIKQTLSKEIIEIEQSELSLLEETKKLELTEQLVSSLKRTVLKLEQDKKDIIEKRIETLSEAKDIYLTFDDGPSALTENVLDVLKKYQIKASFFVIHPAEKYHDLLRRMVKEGHTIGLHSYSHDYKEIYESIDAYFSDIKKLQQEIKEITGVTTKIIRFPGGSSNTISHYSPGIMSTLTKETLSRGYRYYDWNLSSGDGGRVGSSQFIRNATNTKGKNSIMLLMHDSASKKVTERNLEQVIQYYLEKGYDFKPITMDSPMFAHKVRN